MRLKVNITKTNFSLLAVFLMPVFFIYLADSTMSYLFPVVTETRLASNTLVGIVMAFSSFIGLLCDLIFPQIFRNKSWKFFIFMQLILAPFFSVFTYIGARTASLPFFLIAAAFWGIYFECLWFSLQKFVMTNERKENYSRTWSTIYSLIFIAKVIGPILGAYLIDISIEHAALNLVPFSILAFAILIIIVSINSPKKTKHVEIQPTYHPSLKDELNFWKLLLPTIFPIFLSTIVIMSFDAAIWTFGALFGESLFNDFKGLEASILIFYNISGLLANVWVSKLQIKANKKKLTNSFIFLGGLVLGSVVLFRGSNVSTLIIVSVASFVISLAFPLNDSVFSDLGNRLKKESIHLIAISRFTCSLAYILVPLGLGFIADSSDYYTAYSLLGLTIAFAGAILLLITPKKLRLNQKRIHQTLDPTVYTN
jgi:MFS family permease